MTTAHPDDELLSAFLDGEGEDAVAHLSGCSQCQARMADLRAVVGLVAAVSPVAPGDRAARVAAALAAADARSTAIAAPPSTGRSGAERRWSPILVAAAVVVLLGLASIPLLGGRSDDDAGSLASPAAEREQTEMEAAAVDGGDLGDQTDALVLGGRVRSVIEPGGASLAAPSAGATADMASEPSTTTAAGGGGPGGATASDTSKASGTAGVGPAASRSPCTATVRKEYGQGLGPLVYAATLRWQGRPAVALAYVMTGASGNLNHRIFVLASDSCDLLVVQAI